MEKGKGKGEYDEGIARVRRERWVLGGGWCRDSLKSLSGGRSGEGGGDQKQLSSYHQD